MLCLHIMACGTSNPKESDAALAVAEGRSVEALLLPDGQPDWEAVGFEVFCPRCDYNLRTLAHPRCPECGLDIDWHAALDRAAFHSDFLFEHHWRKRPVRSWLKTVWRSFRPRRFWSEVSIHDRIAAGPLWTMLALSVVAFLVALHGSAYLMYLLLDVIADFLPSPRPTPPVLTLSQTRATAILLYDLAAAPFVSSPEYLTFPAVVAMVLLATLALLSSLRQTLGRCKVKSIHVLRVVAYTSTPVLILWSLWVILAACLWALLSPYLDKMGELGLLAFVLACYLMPPAILAAFLGVGLKRYLHLPRAWLVGVVTTIATLLLVFTALTVYAVFSGGGWG